MKLLRYGPAGLERPGVLGPDGRLRDLSMLVPDWDGAHLGPRTLAALRALDLQKLPAVEGSPRIGCPVAGVGKIVCVGLNYADHAKEANLQAPAEPVLFMKATSALCGPDDGIRIPRGGTKTDWEVELCVVIGSAARDVSEEQAMQHVAGYCVMNDVSERAFQLERGPQWDKGKGCDTFGPTGPWLVTCDEVPDPHVLDLWCEVNGKRVQDSNTRHLIFGIPQLVSYISGFMSLQPGDLIATGTPAGVGLGQKPAPWYLKAGDTVRVGIQGLGEQTQVCRAAE